MIVQLKLLSIYTLTKLAVLTLDHNGYNKILKCGIQMKAILKDVQSNSAVRVFFVCSFVYFWVFEFFPSRNLNKLVSFEVWYLKSKHVCRETGKRFGANAC